MVFMETFGIPKLFTTMMPSSLPSPESSARGPLATLPALRNQLGVATQTLEQTLGTMLSLLESQVQELQSLRRALADVEGRLQQTAPQVAALPSAAPSVFSPTVAKPAAPLMTQILWPSKPSPDNEPTLNQAAPRPVLPVAQAFDALPGVPVDPGSEHTTVEALNAALAYAFAQVSNTSPLGAGSITKMIPPPMPTSALRYGSMPEYTR